VTLPASPTVGAQVIVADAGANWGVNNLTVGRNGSTIAGLAENLVCNITGVSVQLVYDGTTWEVYAQVGGNGGNTSVSYIFTTTPVTAINKQGVLADTSGGSFTVTLPASPLTGFQVIVADAGANWGTNNLTVGRNGSTIGGLAENLICDISGVSVQFVYDGTTWEVYAQIGGQSGALVTLDGVQTLTNKDLTSGTNTFPTSLATLAGTQTLTNKTISGASNTLTVDGTDSVGFRNIPQNSQSAAYTLVLSDSGKSIYHPSADTTARTWTIPANASVAFPVGTAIAFVNDTSAGVITIAITSDTLVLSGAGTTGSRTLAANGMATAIKMTSTRWMISGSGLT
jgi:hypothetical protein